MVKEREFQYDYIKGITIFLVIFGHSISHFSLNQDDFWDNPIYKGIYIFHMPLFIFVSGYFFSYKFDFFDYIQKRIKSLLIPAFSTIPFLFIADVLHRDQIHIETSIINHFKYDLWFLKCLFICSSIAVLIVTIQKYIRININIDVLLFLPIPILYYFNNDYLFYTSDLYFFYMLGILFRKYSLGKSILAYKKIFLGFSIISYVIIFFCWTQQSYFYLNRNFDFQIILYRYVGGIAGIMILYIITKYIKESKVLSNIGSKTLGIYIVQTIIFQICGRNNLNHCCPEKIRQNSYY